jgi:hypothetical protein
MVMACTGFMQFSMVQIFTRTGTGLRADGMKLELAVPVNWQFCVLNFQTLSIALPTCMFSVMKYVE